MANPPRDTGPAGLRATARLQFHAGFTLDDAVPLVPYLAQLGISHLYASPILKARPGSTHGYDIVDHGQINPELGGEPALRRLVAALKAAGLGLIIDIVPNHMGVGGADNAWWLDVLEWGRQSLYASFFDIDWEPPDRALPNRMLAPFLGAPYGEVLAIGRPDAAIRRRRRPLPRAVLRAPLPDRAAALPPRPAGRRATRSWTTSPWNSAASACTSATAPRPGSRPRALRAALAARASDTGRRRRRSPRRSPPSTRPPRPAGTALHRLLERQHYRLAWWRAAADEINWRRFFDITSLAGLRVELPEVFDATHELVLKLYAEGVIDGVRIDHVDGLADPRGYCRKLHRRHAGGAAGAASR